MKKPFKYTKVGRFLTSPVIKEAITFIPFVGNFASNVLDEVKGDGLNEVLSEPGNIDTQRLKIQMYALLLLGGVLAGIALAKDWLTIEEIQNIFHIIKN